MMEALQYGFVQRAILAGLLVSVACGVIGAYVVVKRIVFISGGISHASLGGIGIAAWLGAPPLYGAVVFSLLAALVLGLASLRRREREDTLIGAIWTIGMAIGVVFMAMTPGYAKDAMNYLFGNILIVSERDLVLTAALDVVILALVGGLYKELLALGLDDEFAELRGVPTRALYLMLLGLVGLTVVVMIQVVGIVLVIALLTLPAAIGRYFTNHLHTMMLLSCVLGMVFTMAGIAISFATDLPTGACIILTAAAAYVLTYTGAHIRAMRLQAG